MNNTHMHNFSEYLCEEVMLDLIIANHMVSISVLKTVAHSPHLAEDHL
jgi:hypothetical protein